MIDDRLSRHGQVWLDVGEVPIDINSQYAYNRPTYLNFNSQDADISPIDIFNSLFPMDFLRNDILYYTGMELHSSNKQTIHEWEILKFFGIILAMALDPCRGGIDAYFDSVIDADTVIAGRNYASRFGMSKTRFLTIRSCLRLTSGEEDMNNDPWRMVRPFIDAFNGNRRSTV